MEQSIRGMDRVDGQYQWINIYVFVQDFLF